MSDKMQTLGKYQLLEKIGEGGFGVVYRARDPLLERDVAIKVLRADLASAPDFVERFRREARLAASLRHPNIVTVIEVGEQDGRYYLVMDDLPGGSLKNVLEPGNPLPLSQVVELLQPIADALDYAHSRQMVHRDIKPSNILFSAEGKPVITDFGLVKSTIEQGTTTTGTVLGTAEYMAPEQILGRPASPAVDLYSFGVIAYQMCTGRVPFQANTPYEVQNGHVSQPPPDPRSLNPAIPADLAAVLLKALAKSPDQRYPSAQVFISALKQISEQFSQAQASALLSQARSQMDARRFPEAIQLLEQVALQGKTGQSEELLAEARRRSVVWDEYGRLDHQRSMAQEELGKLREQESWLPAAQSAGEKSGAQPEMPPSAARPAQTGCLLPVMIGATLVSMLLTLIFYLRAPNEAWIEKWCNYNYDYLIAPEFSGVFLLLVFLAWLIVIPIELLSRRKKTVPFDLKMKEIR